MNRHTQLWVDREHIQLAGRWRHRGQQARWQAVAVRQQLVLRQRDAAVERILDDAGASGCKDVDTLTSP